MGDTHVGLQARLMSQALRKLTGAISRSKTSVIFTNQLREKVGVMFGNPETTPGGRALKFYASVRLDVRRIDSIKVGTDVVGSRTKVRVVKNKVAPPFKLAEFDIMYNEGISKEGGLLDLGVELALVRKSGAFFSYGETRLGPGPREREGLPAQERRDPRRDRAADPRADADAAGGGDAAGRCRERRGRRRRAGRRVLDEGLGVGFQVSGDGRCERVVRPEPRTRDPELTRAGTVSAIEPQERRGGRRSNVYLDGRYAFSLTTELAVQELRVGDPISDEPVRDAGRQGPAGPGYDAALRFLGAAPAQRARDPRPPGAPRVRRHGGRPGDRAAAPHPTGRRCGLRGVLGRAAGDPPAARRPAAEAGAAPEGREPGRRRRGAAVGRRRRTAPTGRPSARPPACAPSTSARSSSGSARSSSGAATATRPSVVVAVVGPDAGRRRAASSAPTSRSPGTSVHVSQ